MNIGYRFVLLTALISGVSIFLNKSGVEGINPYVFAWSKNLIVALFLFMILVSSKEILILKTLKRKQWLKLAAIGFFGGSIPFLLFFKGLSLAASSTSSLLHKSMFVFIIVLAVIFLREKLNRNFIIAAVLLFAGNLALLNIRVFNFGIPELLISFAVIFWAVETVISKHALKELSAATVAFGRMFFGVLFISVFLAATGNFAHLKTITASQFGWILFTAVLLLFYIVTWYSGLSYIPASSAASILVLGSAVTTTLTFIHAGSFDIIRITGIILSSAGVVAVLRIRFSQQHIHSAP